MKLKDKRILIVGLGESGLAMAKWAARQGARVRVADSRERPPHGDALRLAVPEARLFCGGFLPEAFADLDLIAISPGVPVQEAQVQAALQRGVPLVSEIELFVWAVRESMPQARIVAITGSNGKTTTTALTAHALNTAGVRAIACGNISPSVLDALMALIDDTPEYSALPLVWVVELSSFQLETTHSLAADAATLLNVSEDHLDRHAGMDAYAAAKARVFAGCAAMVLNRDDEYSWQCRRLGRRCISFGLDAPSDSGDYGLDNGWIMRGGERLVALSTLKIAGLHNAANAMATLALGEAIGVSPSDLLPGLAGFSGLAHRVEVVADIGGVSYYDDSKGTNVGATLAAVQGLGRKVVIILGGEGKAQDFSPLRLALARHARAVALIGRDAQIIAAAIDGCGVPLHYCADMAEAVRWCAAQARPGDAVLLSPACASFDMFRNYAHRAEVFVGAVRALAGEGA